MSGKSERPGGGLITPFSVAARLASLLVMAALLVTALQFGTARWVLAAGNYGSAVAADSPVGYWRLDDASGTTAADFSSTHANPLTYQGGYTLSTYPGAISGDPDAAVALNGSTGAVTATKTPTASTTNFSLEAWVNPSTLPQVGVIAYNGQENVNGYGLAVGTQALGSGSKLIGIVGGVGTFDSGYSFAAPNTWYHVVLTRDTSTIRVYVNAVLQTTTSTLVPVAAGARFSLGSAFTSAPAQVYPLAGSVDEAASYNTLLSAGRIQAHSIEGASASSGYGNWATASPSGPPSVRSEPAMGWDAGHNKVVLFGGKGSTGSPIQETWTWDGTTWTKLTPATQPAARWGARLVYDTALGKMVLFGGKGSSAALQDTWTWDGTTWASLSPTTKPSARYQYGLSYDKANSVVVLFGGTTGSAALQDTYTFNGTNWTLKSPTAKPSIRSQLAMAYDDSTSNTVLFGGVNGSTYNAETWTWDGTNWTQKSPNAAASARAGSGLAYNPLTGTEVLIGGVNGSSYFGDTWSWDGSNWANQLPTTSPTVRAGAGFAYNGVKGNDALFGGLSGSTSLNDTLAWNTPPAAPTGVTAVAGNAQATVSWTAPATGGLAISNYQVTPYVGNTPGTTVQVSASPATVTGLTNGTTYSFKVYAKNAAGSGPVGVSNAVTPATVPGAPTAVSAVPGNASAIVSWTAPASNGGSAITSYTITGTPAGSATLTCPCTPPLQQTVSSLTNGTSTTFTVLATNSTGNGPASSASPAIVIGSPTAPQSVTATAGANQATVTWQAPAANNGSAITGYTATAYIGTQAQNRVETGPSTLTATLTGLLGATQYTIQATATNGNGTGPAGVSGPVTPTGTTTTYVSTVRGDSPSAYWRLDDPSGTSAADSSGNGRDGTYNGGVTLASPGLLVSDPDTATILDGSSGYVSAATIPALQGSSTRSVELWFKTTSTGQQPLFDSGSTGTNGQAFIIGLTQQGGMANSPAQNTPGVILILWGNDVYIPGLNLGNGLVHHVVVTVSGTTIRIFVDGASPQGYVRTGTTWSAITSQPFTVGSAPNTASNPVWVGHSRATIDGTGSTYFNGTMDEPAVYPSALTSTQVVAHETASGWAPVAPTGLSATAGANQATITWTSNMPAAAFGGYVVTALNGAMPSNSVAVASSATTATIGGLQAGVAYTFSVSFSNQFGSASATSGSATPTGTAATYASTVESNTPLFYWRLGDSGTTIAPDSSGNGRGGTYSGAYTQAVAGALPNDPDKAFSPTSGMVQNTQINSSLPTGNASRSIEAWINTTATGRQPIAGYGQTQCCWPSTEFDVQIRNGDQIELDLNGGSGGYWLLWNTPYSMANGNWHHIVLTWDGTNATAYLDGQSLGSQSPGSLQTATDGNGVAVGRDLWGGGGAFSGSLDEVALYSTALNGAQVLNHFQQSGNSTPGAPTAVSATAGANQATVIWTAAPSNPAPITGYLVTAYSGGLLAASVGAPANATSAVVHGLKGGTAYTIDAVAINNFGVGTRSVQSSAVTPTGAASTYASTVVVDSPTLYLRLGEPVGSAYAADSSAGGHLVTYQGTSTLGAASALPSDPDTAITNSSGYLFYPSANGLPTGNGARSLEAWINTTSTGTMAIAGYGTNACCYPPTQFALRMKNGDQVELDLNGSNSVLIWNANYSLANGNWHYLVLTWDGTNAIVYVDGKSLGAQQPGGLQTSVDSNGLIVGRDVTDGGGTFSGSLDEVAFYTVALTATQVQNHFSQSGNSAPGAPPAVSASPGPNQAVISWTASPSNPSPVTGYVVTSYLNGTVAGIAVAAPATATAATIFGLQGTANYTFDVVALNNFGLGTRSTPSSSAMTTGAATTYASTVLGDGPSQYSRFSEAAGALIGADSSGTTRAGSYGGTFTLGTPGAIVGDADTSFSPSAGNLQYLGGGGLPINNASRSLEAWFKTSSTASPQAIAGYGPSACCNPPTQFVLRLPTTGNQIEVDLNAGGGGQMFTAPRSLTDGYWHAVVATWNGTTLIVYVDGSSIGTATPGALQTSVDQNGLVIGRDDWDGNGSFSGSLDEVAMYPVALTATQVSNHYAISNAGKPLAPTGLTVTPGTNSAAISWSQPGGPGGPITGYQVTPVVDGTGTEPTQIFSNAGTGANIVNLRGGASYTFQVAAVNQFGVGPSATSPAATVNTPAAAAGLGQNLFLRTTATPPRGIYSFGWVSESNVPAMSTWTVEGFIWGMQTSAPTTSNMAWGLLNGTSGSPSADTPVAGINFNIGVLHGVGGCCDVSFVWPGGSYQLTTGSIPAAMAGSPPAHWALDYDGTNVRGFVNGVLQFTTASASAAVAAAPAGFADQSALKTSYFDEFRVSNTARYTASFAPPTASYSSDANTLLLYDFKEYQVSKLPATSVAYNGNQPYNSVVRPAAFADWSGHGNHASIVDGYNTCCPPMPYQPPMVYSTYVLAPGVTADEVAGGGSPWECSCHFPEGHYPIDTATGEFWHSFDDLSIPGRGPAIDLARTYSSHNAALPSRFGYGWADSYNENITVAGNLVTVHAGNGSTVTFTNNAGVYAAPAQVLATLTFSGGNYTFSDKAKNQYTFNSGGQLTRIQDSNGEATSLTYTTFNGSSVLGTITDPSGSRTLTFSYVVGARGHNVVNQVTDSASRTVQYQYDAVTEDLLQVTDIGGGVTRFTYDSSHQLLTMRDPNCTAAGNACNGGNGVVNVYTNGQVTRQTDYMGRATNYDYTSVPFATKVTDPKGYITLYEYVGSFLFSTTREDQNGAVLAVTTYSYDPNSIGATTVIDPDGDSSTTTRDAQANLLSVTDALGRTTSYAGYNAFNEPQTVTDAAGTATTNTYDANGNLTQVSTPLVGSGQNRVVVYTHGNAQHPGDVTEMTDADGKIWSFGYDAYGNRNSVTDPLTDQTTYVFDSVSRLTSMVSPKGNVSGGNPSQYTTTYSPNAWGQPLTVTDPLMHQTVNVYDGNQNLTSSTDANLHQTIYKYDFDNELTEVDRTDGSTVKTGYDANGNVQTQTDGLTHQVSYGYDSLNRKTSMTDALNRVTSYGYDAAGNLTSLLDPLNQTTGYRYDVANQLLGITYSDGRTPNVSYSYDALGRRLGMQDGTGSSSYSYDSLGRLTQSTNGAGAQLQYSYDLKGQLTSLVYPGGVNTVTRTYDDAGRLHTVQDWLSHTTTFKFDPNSNLYEQDYPNATIASLTYNASDQLTGITHSLGGVNFLSFSYGRDNIGQLSSDGSKGYGYDTINQLQTYTNGASTTYGYDNADRLNSVAISGGGNTNTLAYDNADQLQSLTVTNGQTQISNTTYGFDAKGNRTSASVQGGSTTTSGYDQANRMVNYGANASYVYNGDGLRMNKLVSGNSESYVWNIAEGLPAIVQDGGVSYITGLGGLPIAQIGGSTVYYIHSDQLGSSRAVTDSLGSVQQSYDYDPYGNVVLSSGTLANPFQFGGQYLDNESGLYFLRSRFYDPSSEQFITVDPAVVITRQRYTYVAGNPLNGADPSGLLDLGAGWNALVHGTSSLRPTENNDPNYNPWAPNPVYLAQQNARELSDPTDWGSANAYRVAADDAKFGLYLGATYLGCRGLSWAAGASGFARWAAANSILGRAGPIFGAEGIANSNNIVRIGWSGKTWVQEGVRVGREVFRVAIGTKKWGRPFPIHWDW